MNKNLNDKVVIGVAVVGLIGCGLAFARAQYYQGKIDGRRELVEHWEKMKNELIKNIENRKEA